jgi:hypothetical protein
MNRIALSWVVAVTAACGGSSTSASTTTVEPPASPETPRPPLLFTMTEAGVGPVTTRVLFDRAALAQAFAGYEVVDEPGEGVEDPGIEVRLDGELLLTVRRSAADPDQIYDVVSYSPRVGTDSEYKQIGRASLGVMDPNFAGCECWDGHAACWWWKSHLWEILDKTCTSDDDASLEDTEMVFYQANIIGLAWGMGTHYDEDGPTDLLVNAGGAGDLDL